MTYLTKDRVRQILQNAPDKSTILDDLVSKGHILEGYNDQNQPPRFQVNPQQAQQGQEAGQFLQKPLLQQVFSGRTAKEVPGAIAQTAVGGIPRFLASAAEVPYTAVTGKATGKEYKLPLLPKFQSFQSEAQQRAQEGQPLYKSIGIPAVGTVLAGAETMGAVKGLENLGSKIGEKISSGNFNAVLSDTREYETPSVAEKLFREGKTKETGHIPFLKRTVPQATSKDIERAQTALEYVDPKNATNSIKNLYTGIKTISENEIKPVLEAHKGIWNINQIKNRLDRVPVPAGVKSDAVMQNTFNQVKEVILDELSKTPKKNFLNLWKGRSSLDNRMIDEFGDAVFDVSKPTHFAIKKALIPMRQEINKFVGESVKGGDVFLNALRKDHLLYESIGNIAERYRNQLFTTGLGRLLRSPLAKKIGLGIGGITAVGAAKKIFFK